MRTPPCLRVALAILLLPCSSTAQTFVTPHTLGRSILPDVRSAARVLPNSTSEAFIHGMGARGDEGNAIAALAAFAQANAVARDSAADFLRVLNAATRAPELVVPGAGEVKMAVRVALIAASNDQFEALLSLIPPAFKQALRQERAFLLAAIDGLTTSDAAVFADGSIRGNAKGENGSGVGTGSLAVAIRRGRLHWYTAVAVASTADTVTDGFGSVLLSPGGGRALSSGVVDVHVGEVFGAWGLHSYASVAHSLWAVDDTARSVTILGVGALLNKQIGAGAIAGSIVSVSGDIGLSFRVMDGDVLKVPDDIRLRDIGTKERFFWGLEAGATIQVGQLVGGIQLYHMWPKNQADRVAGISGLQLVAGFSVKGELFRGPLGMN